jgi:branched-chain amino acid transport system ATP-binding protein
MSILSVERLSKHFDGIAALMDVNLSVEQGEIRGIIGPNGSGKTTFINLVSGFLPPSGGRIYFQEEDITESKPHLAIYKGIARTFQIPKILPGMTCLENVMLGNHCRSDFDLVGTWLRLPFARSRQEENIRDKAMQVLESMGVIGAANRMGSDLSWAEEQILQICRALVSEPKLLLLDEPTAGMGEVESQQVQDLIKKIQARGITIIVVAHDMKLISRMAEKVTCLSFGNKIAEGLCRNVLDDPRVHEVYLGAE